VIYKKRISQGGISGTVVAGFFLYYLLSRKKIMNTMNPRANQLQ